MLLLPGYCERSTGCFVSGNKTTCRESRESHARDRNHPEMSRITGTKMIGLIVTIHVAFAVTGSASNTSSLVPRCVSKYSNIPTTLIKQFCLPYQYPNGYCSNIVHWPVFGTKVDQQYNHDSLQRFIGAKRTAETLFGLTPSRICEETFKRTYCARYFPKCDLTTDVIKGQPLCQETCEHLFKVCKKEFGKLMYYARQFGLQDRLDIIKCSSLPSRNGGGSPKCYYNRLLNNEKDKLKSKDCYYGNGLGYHGDVSVTRSGHVCQSWSSQCPHRHNHPLAEYPELIHASNSCRNPGGQAPNGPWCYTTSTGTRWEYCNVRKCPAPGSSRTLTPLPPSTVTSLPPSSVTSLPPSSVTSLPPSSVTSLPPSSVTSLPPSSVNSLPPSNVTSLPPSSVTSLPPSKTKSLPTRCIPAYPQFSNAIMNYFCLPYQYSNKGFCRGVVHWPVFGSLQQQRSKHYNLNRFSFALRTIKEYPNFRVSPACIEVFNHTYCRWYFPKCDATTSFLTRKPVCKESCDYLIKVCKKEFTMVERINKKLGVSDFPFSWDIMNCSSFTSRNGGDSPECYYNRHLNSETDKLASKVCYYGNGLGYHGILNVTRSGHVCQSWSSQCPHRHDHPLAEYPELVNASNSCRNPGGQAPNGPWCYTNSTGTRWEYCNVRKCPAPGPTRSPQVIQAFSTGPNKISIEWRPVPLPFVHGIPGGFRIRTYKLGADDSIINTTTPDTKYFELKNLQPKTDYVLSVLEFNEHKNGPWSTPVHVQTKPQNFIAIKFTLILKDKNFSSDLLERNSRRYRNLKSNFTWKLEKLLTKTESEKYKIYQIKFIKFFNGSVGVEFDVTSELINTTTSWFATQSITGRLLQETKTNQSEALAFTSLLVQAPPPPPVNLSQSNVSTTSVVVHWFAPAHSGPFRITNYTVQYKKDGTEMPYYDAVMVGANKREVVVDNLDWDTQYLMRVKSINSHGSQPSVDMAVQTSKRLSAPHITPSFLTILIPPAIMLILLIGAALLFWKWWHKKRIEERKLREKIERLRENPYESEVDWFKLLKIQVFKEWWEIPRDDLELDYVLGAGQFGVVKKGLLKKIEEGNQRFQHCAVKMLKEYPTERELRDLCNEINVMSSIGDHGNIVSLIGACTINGPPLLVLKFAPNGCLLDYLKESRPLPDYENCPQGPDVIPKIISEKERLKFAYEIAQGMSHLEKHRYVHRDLAARNILLGKNMVAMVSDFGLSRDVYQNGAYENTEGGIIPVRWMAIESLEYYTYTTESDVWSYGVLLWEIETGGMVPYGGLSGLEILDKLKQGYRLEKPRGTSRDLYSMMWGCWNPDPKQRPNFSELVYQLGGHLSYFGGNEDVSLLSHQPSSIKGNEQDEEEIKLTLRNGNVIESNNVLNERLRNADKIVLEI